MSEYCPFCSRVPGDLIVISGPSGVGKTTIVELLSDIVPEAARAITCTSRPMRDGETDGEDYHFLTRDEFERRIAAGEFLEYAEYAGNLYGSSKKVIDDLRAGHDAVFMILDVNGARAAKKAYPDAKTIFLTPSGDELRGRIAGRKGMDPEELQRRLAQIEKELAYAEEYDHTVTNVDGRLGKAIHDIMCILDDEWHYTFMG